jgi:hypothetical protein
VSTTRTLVWYPESGTDVNVSVVITTPGADYTSLASFGSATDFGSNLVASMDRSFMRGKGRPVEEVGSQSGVVFSVCLVSADLV